MIRPEVLAPWQEEISDHQDKIDPGAHEDWYSMALGWAIAKGMSLDDACDFAHDVNL